MLPALMAQEAPSAPSVTRITTSSAARARAFPSCHRLSPTRLHPVSVPPLLAPHTSVAQGHRVGKVCSHVAFLSSLMMGINILATA